MEEIIIRGGTIVDGTGAPGYRGDIAVSGGKITAMGDLKNMQAEKYLDADGMIVAPGFFDMHAHSDTSFLQDDSSASKLYQGITTEVTGQCGSSPFPARPGTEGKWESFEGFYEEFEEKHQMAVNQAVMTGHGTLRSCVMGKEDRAPTPDEMEEMKALLRRDLAAGAWGLSLGLE